MDTRSTDRITGKLENLTMREKYSGREQIHTTSGAGMMIDQIGHSIINTPTKKIFIVMMSYMFPKETKTLFSFIVLLQIIMPLLNFTLLIFLSRIRQ